MAQGIYVELNELLGLEQQARHITDGLTGVTQNMLQGNRPSTAHGRGGAFDQIRHYLAGDDVRNIDWNVTARMGKPFVRVFNEERETPLMVLIDQSSSLFFATQKQMKSVVAAKVAGYLLWMSHHLKRPCGSVILGDDSYVVFRPKSNKSHLYGMLENLVEFNHKLSNTSLERSQRQNFTQGLRQLNQHAAKDAFVVIISDFINIDEEGWQLIERMGYRANVITTPVYDGVLDALPEQGQFLARFANLEAELDFSSNAGREVIAKGSRGRIETLNRRFAELAIPVLPFSTYEDPEQQLLKGLFIDGGQHD